MKKVNELNKREYRADIDGLRAIAILSVLIFHIDYNYLSGGFVGVDIFFVISGFLITGIIKTEVESSGKFSFSNFYIRRVRRLFPAMLVVFILTSVFSVLILSPTHLASFGGSLVSSVLSLSNLFFWIEADYFDTSANIKPLLHTWSLSVEEQFYFFWPLTLLLLLKFKNRKITYFAMFLLVVLSFYMNDRFDDGSLSFINNYLPEYKEYFADGKSTIFFLLPFRTYEFIFGASVVWLSAYTLKSRYLYDILFFLGLSLIIYSIFFFNDKMLFPSYYGILPTLGTALLIYSGKYSRFNFLLSNKLFVSIGLISYSLYLVHWPIIVFVNYLFNDLTVYDQLLILIASILLAILSYRYIEQPFRKKSNNRIKNALKYISLILIIVLLWSGYNMYNNNGWEWRINSPVKFEKVGDSKDFHRKFYGGEGYPYVGNTVSTTNPADIVVLGDSHARHYMEGLYKVIAKPNNYNLYIASTSCILLPGFTRVTKGNNFDEICPNRLKNGIDFIKKGKNPVVILSESWLFQLSVADLLDKNGKRMNKKVTADDVIEGIKKLKKQIGDGTLIVIGNVPGAGANLYDIFSRPRPIFFTTFEPSDYIKTAKNNLFVSFNEKLKKEAQRNKEFIFLDPHDILCEGNKCRNLDSNNHLIYSDSYHLSKYGSIEVIKGFKSKINKILDNR